MRVLLYRRISREGASQNHGSEHKILNNIDEKNNHPGPSMHDGRKLNAKNSNVNSILKENKDVIMNANFPETDHVV